MDKYFGRWLRVIDKKELFLIVNKLNILYKEHLMCPSYNDIFKVFNVCDYDNLRVVILGYDPYPQPNVATGIAFGNKLGAVDLSPSLRVIKDSLGSSIYFDETLESWCKQGVLLLNSSLTVQDNTTGSNTMLWRPFITKLLNNLSDYQTGIIYVLLGQIAQSFEPYINKRFNYIIKEHHPSYYYRTGQRMPNIFNEINKILYGINKEKINWNGEQEDKAR